MFVVGYLYTPLLDKSCKSQEFKLVQQIWKQTGDSYLYTGYYIVGFLEVSFENY